MTASAKTLTFEEFEQLPEKPGKQELLEGDLIELPPPTELHSKIMHALFDLLRNSIQGVRMETAYRLAGSICVQPDLSIPHPDQPASKYLEGAPMLAVEIISPANRAPDVQRKLTRYFDHGAQEVWLIYPGVVEVHDAAGSSKHTGPFTSSVLPGLTIDPALFLTSGSPGSDPSGS